MMKKKISIAIIFIVTAMIITSVFYQPITKVSADSKEVKEEPKEALTDIYVEVKGAVISPGVYKIKSDKRLFDVITLAGGLSEDANTDYINQTRILQDQTLIVIMTNSEIEEAINKQELIQRKASEVSQATEEKEVIGYDSCYTNNVSSSSAVSINTANQEQLMTLSGIGEAKANDIISYREANGGFKNIEELKNVNGIGEATFNKIKDSITL